MSVELVNRFCIKKDGVYINTHSNNDTAPFHSVKLNHISETYLYRNSGVTSKWQALKEFVKCFSFYESLRTHGNDEHILLLEKAINYASEKYKKHYSDKIFDMFNKTNEYQEYNILETLYDNLQKTVDDFVYEVAAIYYVQNGGAAKWNIDIDELKKCYTAKYWEV